MGDDEAPEAKDDPRKGFPVKNETKTYRHEESVRDTERSRPSGSDPSDSSDDD